jgi:hypothetical protein
VSHRGVYCKRESEWSEVVDVEMSRAVPLVCGMISRAAGV